MTLRARLRELPPDALLPVGWLLSQLDDVGDVTAAPTADTSEDWRSRVWTCADDTLLGVAEIADAVGRSTSWVYRRTGPRGREPRLPMQRVAGNVVMRADSLRQWIRRQMVEGAA
jgi:predicted DNA-binding transcriptional regulator AlpA